MLHVTYFKTLSLWLVSDLHFNRRTDLDIQQVTAEWKETKDVNVDVILQILSGDSDVLLRDPKNPTSAAEGQSLTVSDAETCPTAGLLEDTSGRSAVKRESNDAIANQNEHRSTDHIQIVQDFILESLAFSAMKDREEDVVEAHGETLDWLFGGSDTRHGSAADKPAVNFPTWLRDDQSIFWVNGKAGSGKSTLMRYIFQNKRTFKELRKWAEKKPLVIAGYYFWTSGSVEQRSQAGLLRYLLFQLLQDHRHLMPITFPRTWNQYVNSSTKDRIKAKIVWELPDLAEGLRLFLENALRSVKICLFVDGLDEFDGDHEMIIQFFKGIASISKGNIKLCLSSRPWSVFEKAFQNLPTFRLQDLTYQDMVEYVTDKFRGDQGLRTMLQDEALDGEKLVAELVIRADGVFLWVTLVVRFLTRSFCKGDLVLDLGKRLLLLPTSLDDLFQYTLFDIQSSSSLHEASSIFQLIRAREAVCEFTGDLTSTSLNMWELALAREPYGEAIATELRREKNNDALRRCQDTKAIVNGCCAGLLGIKDNTRQQLREIGIEGHSMSASEVKLIRSKVTYIHRTVRDFLMSPDAWNALLQYTSKQRFDPHICHIVSFVLQLKLPLHEPTQHRILDEWWPGIVLSMTHARLSHPYSAASQHLLINQVNSTLSRCWLSRRGDTWARSAFGSYEQRHRAVIDNPFLSLATKFGLNEYVRSELEATDQKALSDTGGKPLLGYALDFLINRQLTVYPLADPTLIGIILSHDSNPNKAYNDFAQKEETPWLYALKGLRDGNRRGWIEYYDVEEWGVVRWVGIMKMLLEAGADPNALIVETKWDPEATALEVVEMVCERFKSKEMKGLRDLMLEKGAKRR